MGEIMKRSEHIIQPKRSNYNTPLTAVIKLAAVPSIKGQLPLSHVWIPDDTQHPLQDHPSDV
ncbi:hypothetical protein DPMN_160046 [Dreissena polymorpha]|uniref:Uncharacterized protein n=1 Tax=Dreissena polymorpha TaxID=45954 RepID=A0A9D4IPR2_DREPO|nr:hypothetical protein DPMN_160046 [Dreissena polymorpha]